MERPPRGGPSEIRSDVLIRRRQPQTLYAASGQPTYFGKTVRRYGKLACITKNQAHLKEKSGISARSLADEKVCDRWRKRENATLKKLETLAIGLAIISLILASTWWIADSTKKTEALNSDQIWLAD
jgi:hypothetical protein